MTRWLVACALLTLAACVGSSAPTHFFTLSSVPASGSARGRLAAPIEVDAVHIPPTIDRRWMIRAEHGPALTISGQDRWAGSLGMLSRRVLSQDLARRLAPDMVIAPGSPAPANTRGLVVNMLVFEPRGTDRVVLDADWTLVEGIGARPVLRRTVHLSHTEGPSATTEAQAMSALLGRLADHIAAGIEHADQARASP